MIRGYVSSDEEDYDIYDFGYSESLIVERPKPPTLPEIKNPDIKEKLHSVLEESKKIELFLKAIDAGDLNAVEELISRGVSVDCTDSQEWTPLVRACGAGNFEVVQLLLERGADPNKHRELFTPLMTCCTHTLVGEDLKLGCARLLLQHGAQINARDKFQTTALMYAAGSGYADIVTEFLGVPDVNLNAQDREGWTALFHAVNNDSLNIVEKLVAAGTDLKLKDKCGRTVITLAVDKNFKNVAKALGYVEEPCVPEVKETLKDRFLKELPDSNGRGGFPSDARHILNAFNQFNVKTISLPDLLNATDKDLYEIGVKLQPDRFQILSRGIHRYHLYPWRNSSMHQITRGVPMSLEVVIAIAGSLARHLTIANASIRYLNARISARQNKEPVDLAVEKELIVCLVNSYKSSENLKALLSKLLKHIEQIRPEIPADYIYPFKKEKHRKIFAKKFWCTVAAVTAGFLIYFKPALHFRTISTMLSHFFQPEPLYEYFDSELMERYTLV